MNAPKPRRVQLTVGELRAELVGLPDDMVLVVDVCQDPHGAGIRRHPLIGAGYGPDVDSADPLFDGQEFPLTAGYRA